MPWMITDHRERKGTCYMEVLPGKFAGEHWNPQSVFFREEHFGFIERTILRHCPKYDHYAFTDINRSIWQGILTDLQQLHRIIAEGARLCDIREKVSCVDERWFLQSETENLKLLRQMLNAFIRWTRTTLESHDSIAVLGM